jgi:hypothetical protein
MSSTYSTNLELELPGTGDQAGQWGVTANRDMGTLIEQAIAGYVVQQFNTDSDVTLDILSGADGGGNTTPGTIYSPGTTASPVSGRNAYIECTGTITANKNLIVPTNKKIYYVYNNTTGGFSIVVKTSAGTGITVTNGSKVILLCNGTNVIEAVSYSVGGGTGPGSFTTLTASGAVSGVGFNNLFASPPAAIGSTTPVAGSFTNLNLTGATIPANGVYLYGTNTLGVATNSTLRATYDASGTLSLKAIAGTSYFEITNGTTTFRTYIETLYNGIYLGVTSNHPLGILAGGAINSRFWNYGGISILAPSDSTKPALSAAGAAFTPPVAVTFSATAMAVNCATSNVFTTTFTANVTVAPSMNDPSNGQTINWFIAQDATGSRTMTWPTSFKWPGGTAGVLSTAANSVDLVVATYRSGTGFWYATLTKAFA